MIKYGIIFTLILVGLVKTETLPDRDTLLQFVHNAVMDCYEDDAKTIKVELTDAAFEALITSDPNPPRNTKCARYCVMKSHNLLNDDETLNSENMKNLFTKVYPNTMTEEKLKSVQEASEKCTAPNAENKCELAHQLAMCVISTVGK